MNANQVASSKVNVKKQNEMKTKTSSMLEAEQTKTSSMLEAEQDEDEDFMYARTEDGTLKPDYDGPIMHGPFSCDCPGDGCIFRS